MFIGVLIQDTARARTTALPSRRSTRRRPIGARYPSESLLNDRSIAREKRPKSGEAAFFLQPRNRDVAEREPDPL